MKTLNDNCVITNYEDIKVVDNFFTKECLEILKTRVLYNKYFDHRYPSYVSIDYFPNQDYLTESGVDLHCDPSVINLNIWVSSNESVLDPEKNGLNIYKVMPPKEWTRDDWNGDLEKSIEYVKSKNVEPVKIKYKSNRAIFFNGAYFHKTNEVSMKKGFENRRISYTLLFGNNLEE